MFPKTKDRRWPSKFVSQHRGNIFSVAGLKAVAKPEIQESTATSSSEAGLGRQALYRALSETGNPTLETFTAVLDALGLQLSVQPRAA